MPITIEHMPGLADSQKSGRKQQVRSLFDWYDEQSGQSAAGHRARPDPRRGYMIDGCAIVFKDGQLDYLRTPWGTFRLRIPGNRLDNLALAQVEIDLGLYDQPHIISMGYCVFGVATLKGEPLATPVFSRDTEVLDDASVAALVQEWWQF